MKKKNTSNKGRKLSNKGRRLGPPVGEYVSKEQESKLTLITKGKRSSEWDVFFAPLKSGKKAGVIVPLNGRSCKAFTNQIRMVARPRKLRVSVQQIQDSETVYVQLKKSKAQ